MIWVDYAILALIFVSLIIGLFRGFIREAFSLCTWIVAVWVGLTFSRELSGLMEGLFSLNSIRMAVAFAILFFTTLLLGSLVSYLIGELVKKTGLTGTDRVFGMVFGLLRGMLVVVILVMLAGLTPFPEDPWWKESLLIPPFQVLALWLHDHLPAGIAGYINYR
ncbi:MAG: CvpA family protein [Methylococcaceae bacterium]